MKKLLTLLAISLCSCAFCQADHASYSNAYFTITFPEEMELSKDEGDEVIFKLDNYFFLIKSRSWSETASRFLDRLAEKYETEGQYEKIEKKYISTSYGTHPYIVTTQKRKEGKIPQKRAFIVLDKSVFGIPDGKIYVLSCIHLWMEDAKEWMFLETLKSIKAK